MTAIELRRIGSCKLSETLVYTVTGWLARLKKSPEGGGRQTRPSGSLGSGRDDPRLARSMAGHLGSHLADDADAVAAAAWASCRSWCSSPLHECMRSASLDDPTACTGEELVVARAGRVDGDKLFLSRSDRGRPARLDSSSLSLLTGI